MVSGISQLSHVTIALRVGASNGSPGRSAKFVQREMKRIVMKNNRVKQRNVCVRAQEEKANFVSSLVQNLMGGGGPSPSVSSAAARYISNNAPSWEELESILKEQKIELGVVDEDLENGPPNPHALKRTFGQTDQEPRIKLYRDHAAWCPYCHKIVLQLEEKKIPYIVEKINMRCYGAKPAEFMRKVPSGLLPVLEVDGQIITESAVIQELLETWYPQNPLLPPEGTTEYTEAKKLMQLERELFGQWLGWLCNGWDDAGNRAKFEKVMDKVDAVLGMSDGPYFLSAFSLVDITFAPFLERIVASIIYYKGLIVRGSGPWENIESWFDAMETRPAYMAFKSDFYTHCHDLPPQLGGCEFNRDGPAFASQIDGTDGTSWALPLDPITQTSIEPLSMGDSPAFDRFLAASKLVKNNKAVTRFALRGVGQPGDRPVSAPLADPTAKPDMSHEASVDAALRHVANFLLHGTVENGTDDGSILRVQTTSSSGFEPCAPIPDSLMYLRDRVGVPRDMPYPAARQLRAHLNWVIDRCQQVSD